MAAVARALGERDVTFFPSHAGEPGEAASEGVRQVWQTTPRIVLPALDEVLARLRAASEDLLGGPPIDVGRKL